MAFSLAKENSSDHGAVVTRITTIETYCMKDHSKWIIGELIGTFLLVFFGCGSVASAVTSGALVGLFQVAIVWGLAISMAIQLTGSLSGAHLNPAVTIAMAIFRDFPKSRLLPYVVVQMVGAFLASAALYLVFAGPIQKFEEDHNIARGMQGSEASAKIFGEYFPNPGNTGHTEEDRAIMPHASAFAAEIIGTAILLLVIFCVTDPKNSGMPPMFVAPTIGLTVTLLICLLGPLTMACFNPARDLAPRLFSSLVGWKNIPFTTNGHGWLTVYIVAPIVGAVMGGLLYTRFLKPAYEKNLT
jgi:glycerol uptake facilitator protein